MIKTLDPSFNFPDFLKQDLEINSIIESSWCVRSNIVSSQFIELFKDKFKEVFDLDLENMTVWFYGNDVVLNVSYNVSNGTSLTYNWSGLDNGNYNWSVIANDGKANSTREYGLFIVNRIIRPCNNKITKKGKEEIWEIRFGH